MLILGGTRFVGRHIVDAALARGHEVTIFHRGKTKSARAREVESLLGDRDNGLRALAGRTWDAAIDVNGYVPRIVAQSVQLLSQAVGHYTFVSSISVYASIGADGRLNERAPVQTVEDEAREDCGNPEAYGALKILSERAVDERFADRAFVPRLSLVVGPYDHTDRYTYWPTRVARGGEVLAFGTPNRLVTPLIDVRDAAAWIVQSAEEQRSGIFNLGGPSGMTIGAVLNGCVEASSADALFIWANDDFLLGAGVGPWIELPLWVPAEDDITARLDTTAAHSAGLKTRSLAETARATLAWDQTRPAEQPRAAGLAPDREQELIRQWSERASQAKRMTAG